MVDAYEDLRKILARIKGLLERTVTLIDVFMERLNNPRERLKLMHEIDYVARELMQELVFIADLHTYLLEENPKTGKERGEEKEK